MSKNKQEKTKEETIAEQQARETWDSWIVDLEDKEQPSCNIDNPDDCDSCGS